VRITELKNSKEKNKIINFFLFLIFECELTVSPHGRLAEREPLLAEVKKKEIKKN